MTIFEEIEPLVDKIYYSKTKEDVSKHFIELLTYLKPYYKSNDENKKRELKQHISDKFQYHPYFNIEFEN